MNHNMVAGSLTELVHEDEIPRNTDEKEASEARDDEETSSNARSEPRASSRGNLVERMAARAGFNAPRLNTESIRPPHIPKHSDGQPPFLMTIPPGLSPTTLLESPVFLNSQIMPSPTTGKFSFALSKGLDSSFQDNSSFTFKSVAESGSLSRFDPANNVYAPGSLSVHADSSYPNQSVEHTNHLQAYAKSHGDNGVAENSPPQEEANENGDQSGGSPADDGYSWRKYGQKQVKGSEYPRSYYKCTHENCPVKKQVERSHEGDITEIIYMGGHNHPKPLPDRKALIGSSTALSDMNQSQGTTTGVHSDLVWSSMQKSSRDNPETTSSMPMHDGLNGSSTFSNDEDDECGTRSSVCLGYDGGGDEPELKRRRNEAYIPEMIGVNRAIKEPRVVVQTLSEIDILDDGYRWRKYGQKVVKGNPNPRSYYKCTSPGCNVRKHVERASNDLKSVITTYEGKHNHEVPASRNSSHVNPGCSNTHLTPQIPVSSHLHRPELSQMLANTARFGRPEMGSFYGLGVSHLGLPGLAPKQGKFLPFHHPYLGHQSPPQISGLVLPKVEPKLETLTTDSSGMLSPNSASIYQQFMS